MKNVRVFLFDDESAEDMFKSLCNRTPGNIEIVRDGETPKGHKTVAAITVVEDPMLAYSILSRQGIYDVIILDNSCKQAKVDAEIEGRQVTANRFGLDFLLPLSARTNPKAIKVMITGRGAGENQEMIIDAVESGADVWFTKPETDGLFATVLIAIRKKGAENERRSALLREAANRRAELEEKVPAISEVVGITPEMLDIYEKVTRYVMVSPDTPFLLLGESGVGKDRIARLIHDADPVRHSYPYGEIDLASISENTAESELFGHEKGAFTGAYMSKKGLVETANKGTLFINEINSASHHIQKLLLRFAQYKQFRKMGSLQDSSADVRLVFAANEDLWKAVEEGKFRKDLYYRIAVVPIYIPPLRERREDIVNLATRILQKKDFGSGLTLSRSCAEQLEAYPWGGNVRELETFLERGALEAISHKRKVIEWEDCVGSDRVISKNISGHSSSSSIKDVEEIKRKAIALVESLKENPQSVSALLDEYSRRDEEQVVKFAILYFLALHNSAQKSKSADGKSPMDKKCLEYFNVEWAGLRSVIRERTKWGEAKTAIAEALKTFPGFVHE